MTSSKLSKRANSGWVSRSGAGACAKALAFLAVTACGAAGEDQSATRAIQGELTVSVADYETHERLVYQLTADDGQRFSLVFPDEPALTSGVRIQLNSVELTPNNELRVLDFEAIKPNISQHTQALANAVPVRTRRIAVLLAQGTTVTKLEALDRLKNAPTSLASYFRTNSFGVQDIDGNVFGPYSSSAATTGCDTFQISEQLKAAFEAQGNRRADFDHFVHVLPPQPSCGWVGFAEIGTPNNPQQNSWYKTTLNRVLFPHEIGHNFGLQHPVMIKCPGAPLTNPPSACDTSLNGHPYDPLGGGYDHYAAYHKGFLGWFGGCNGVLARRDGIFNLLPQSERCDGIQTLRVPTGIGSEYFFHLDYRKNPNVFDGDAPEFVGVGPSGVNVDVAPASFGDGNASGPVVWSIDMDQQQFGTQSYLILNQPYTAPSGVTMTLLSLDASRAQVRLQFPGGGTGINECLNGSAAPTDATGKIGPNTCGGQIPSTAKLIQKTSNLELSLSDDTARNGNVNAEAASAELDHHWLHENAGISNGIQYYYLKNRKSGMRLNVSGAATFDGANIAQWDTSGDHFSVALRDQGNGYFKLQFKHVAKFLCTFSTSNGSNAQLCPDSTTDNKIQWQRVAVGSGYYKFVQRGSGLELSLAHALQRNGNVNALPASSTQYKSWTFGNAGSGYYWIRNTTSNMYMNVSGANLADNANVAQWDNNSGDHYLVRFLDQGDGYYKLQFKHSGKYLCTYSASSGSTAQQCSDSTSSLLRWRIQ